MTPIPKRQIRALYGEQTVTVYQAYSPEIVNAAVAAGRFCTGFDIHTDAKQRKESLSAAPVRFQWDPERDLHLRPLAPRAIQIGLGGDAVRRYKDEWTVQIDDITSFCHEVHALVSAGDLLGAQARLPAERPYPEL